MQEEGLPLRRAADGRGGQGKGIGCLFQVREEPDQVRAQWARAPEHQQGHQEPRGRRRK